MIKDLDKYCELWNFEINLDKSKKMIFSKGSGKLNKKEKWNYRGNDIEVVKNYKYLGIKLSPKLVLKAHLLEKITTAKFGINSLWNGFLMKNKVPINAPCAT